MADVYNKKTKEDFAKELQIRFPHNRVEILEFEKASGYIKYKCLDCGRVYEKTRANHMYENKTLCSKCYTARKSKTRDLFIELIEKNKDFEIINFPQSTYEKTTIKCLKCGREQQVKISNFVLNERHSCCYCGRNGAPVIQEEFEKKMKENNKIGYEIIAYKNSTSSMLIKHECGFCYKVLPHNFLKSRGCPKCFHAISKGEMKIMNYLDEHNIRYESQKKFPESILGQQRFDFYLPDYNTLIEYQGEQHYKIIEHWGGKEKFEERQKHDAMKRTFAKDNEIILLEICYKDYNRISEILTTFLEGSTTTSVDSSESKEKLKQ